MSSMQSEAQSPFETILVGVDFSTTSQIVVHQAQQLAQQLHAKIILVHAAPTLGFELSPPQYSDMDYSLVDTDQLVEDVKNFYQIETSSNLEIVVEEGYPPEVIIGTARKHRAPLIVLGSQGRNAVSRFILGSHAERIALESPYPVWIHRGNSIVPFSRALVPTDLSDKSRKLILQIKDWAQAVGLSPKYLFVRPEIFPLLDSTAYREMSEELRKSVQERIDYFKHKSAEVPIATVPGQDPSQQISRVGRDYDFIVMNPHSHSEIFHRFGRVTSRVMRLSQKPVLVMKT